MFNKDSGLVKIWVRLIQSGKRVVNDIPEISNLKEIVINSLEA